MKRLILLSIFSFFVFYAFPNGVAIKNATEGVYLKLVSSEVEVTVNNQVAVLTATQVYLNDLNEDSKIKYAFPIYDDASATNLKWFVNGMWQTAVFSPTPQDTTLPGGGDPDPDLMQFLGETPLFFNVPDTVTADSLIIFELTYVQLLPYDFGIVDFKYPNDYHLIQNSALEFQKLFLTLESDRTIEAIDLVSHENATITNSGNVAEVVYEEYSSPASTDYHLIYQLSSDELGLFSFSTCLPDSANECDNLGNGFLGFVVEPDPNDSLDIIPKVFTLIVDRSGSMSGNKMVQARNAASFIVNNLNEGDYFNIVDFSEFVSSFADDHVLFNETNQNAALSYIEGLQANGLTNISGAFSNAIADFAGNDTTVANIIIFFTDGIPTAGIISTNGILNHIQDKLEYWEVKNLMVHSFGIGEDVNQQLLAQISAQNMGLSAFLLDSELESMITSFYLRIRNPVLLNTQMSFDPPVVIETYPDPLTNLYLGQQLIVVGRYDEGNEITAIFEGEAFGQPQTYTYDFELADTLVEGNSFLTKIWAKKKIEHLFVEYLSYPPNSPTAEEIKEQIIEISMCYNVMSPFTSLTGGGTVTSLEFAESPFESIEEQLTYNYPNPFYGQTKIYFIIKSNYSGPVSIVIYDLFGRQLYARTIQVAGPGKYAITWNGANMNGNEMPEGHYFYSVTYGSERYSGRMVKQ